MRHVDKSAGTSDKCKSAGHSAGRSSASSAAGCAEVRTTFDKNEYRVFFYVAREQVVVVHSTVVLVHGIHKKTQKTPPADIVLAQRRMKEGT